MVDAVVGVLIQNLMDSLLNERREVLQFHNQFKKMKRELPYMQGFLKDADKVRIKDQKQTLKEVARDLREVLYKAEDIIADCELFVERGECKCMNYFSLLSLKYCYQMRKRLSQINQEIGDLRERMQSYRFPTQSLSNEEQAGSSRPIRYPILMTDAEIVGIEDDIRKIKQWIMEARGPLHVIGIVGMGGIGKTTLAENIKKYYDQVKESFKHVLFVNVSQTFKFDELLKKMLKKLDVDDTKLSNIDVHDLLEELRKQLHGNRYLIILDDVWRTDEGSWWESFKSALPRTNKGGCVVVTTRNEEVARSMGALENNIHKPKLLSNGEDWSLFSKIAFANDGGHCRNPKIEQIGRELVAKCKGLPLAIKVMGGAMLGKGDSIHEWRRISKHLKEELAAHDEEIFTPLQLSYEELPMHLKPCMLYFTAFREDYEISDDMMVYLWIGEGFVRGRDGRAAFEIGLEYFDELVCRGLLLGTVKDDYERRFIWCKVHDMVRDMIINIAKDENFMGLDNRGMLSCTDRSRRVGIVNSQMSQTNSQLLRTIIGVDLEENEEEFALNVGPKLCKLKWLRVLHVDFGFKNSFGGGPLKLNWLNGIGSLAHLICLTIKRSRLDELPNSIEKLKNLQVLHLSVFRFLKRLPKQLTTLERLTILDLHECLRLEYLPKGVGKLSNLESLMGFKILNSNVDDVCHLSDLKMLIRLRRLELFFYSVDRLTEGELTVLSELKQLEFLKLFFVGTSEEIITKVDCMLPPLQKLQELQFHVYKGEKTPVWINPTTLPNLRRLCIQAGDITRMSTEFFGNNNIVWDLETLILRFLRKLKVDWLAMKMVMPSLRKLEVDDCGKLEAPPWSNDGWTKEGDALADVVED